jgi:hypothetical protein
MSANPTTPSPAVQAMNTALSLQAGGLQVNSTATPALNGRYACDAAHLQAISLEAASIALNTTFCDGSTALNWPDMQNAGHSFNVAQFHNFAVAVGNFVVQCLQYGCGLTTTQPPTTATIA